jgi:hypothetical protein
VSQGWFECCRPEVRNFDPFLLLDYFSCESPSRFSQGIVMSDTEIAALFLVQRIWQGV